MGLEGEFPLPGASPMRPGARRDPSRVSLAREDEVASTLARVMVVDAPEEAAEKTAAAAGASMASRAAPLYEGDARERPIMVGEETTEVTLTPVQEM